MTSAQLTEERARWKREQEEEYRESERQRRRASIERALGGAGPIEDYTFEKFNPELNGTHRVLKACMGFDPLKENLFILGPQGTGKTHLSTAIARNVLDRGGRARVFRGKELAAQLKGRKNYANDFDEIESILDLSEVHCIVVDDIEDGPDRDGYLSALKVLMEHRKNNRRFGWVITSNKTIEELVDIVGPKIADRIQEMKHLIIPASTPSARSLLKAAKKSS